MIWDVNTFRALSRLVDKKFDEFRLDDNFYADNFYAAGQILDKWKEYLKLHGIERVPAGFKKRGSKETYVWIECPWSVHNSTPGAVYTKSNLYFTLELAEKIIVLEGMP
jgi:hypothetical protein